MKRLIRVFCCLVATTAAFTPSQPSVVSSTYLSSSYLDGMSAASTSMMKPASYGFTGSSYGNNPQQQQESFGASLSVPQQQQQRQPASSTAAAAADDMEFSFAPASYFAKEKLVSKGPRPTADWGTPADASLKLCDDGTFRAGSWYCTEGGWPSSDKGKAVTEVFYVAEGYGSLDDADGVRHYFGPGDTVIIPKGHTGRWDVYQPIHKVWAVNAHDNIEERGQPIRIQVDRYNSLAPHFLTPTLGGNDPLYGQTTLSNSAGTSSKTFYNVGPTQVGAWTSEAGNTVQVHQGKRAWIHLLEGIVVITNAATGVSRRCVAGDTMVVPAGWCGYVDVIQRTKKLWTVAL
mmetsp:Transcript_27391/g.41464  ORF Transcript_27391/g.41464 Transcript_27391/m.41464 type:complete len:346 (+) Transcript_27391:172-1209(+)|eukprot:CAMPEP_0178920664 /NCGR_PEP_ID=MMETSP0786-20121207/15127_1 /TAXON_ID=186022 /ORGANISM="Thalassionema frauenfeldii, Strain CCMP 1798" /LENGTH=345 /DNA_ID=CAMNT_0020594749 /DNA_START=86 /DNA_END=1123 /DNA_ORIENTATION=+